MTQSQIRFGGVGLDVAASRLDHEDTLDERFALLRAFVRDTFDRCTYHRNRMERGKFHPDQLTSLDDLRRIPILSPEDVGAVPETQLLPDALAEALATNMHGVPAGERVWRRFASTGTTGLPKVSYYTREDWDVACAASMRATRHPDPALTKWRLFNCFYAGHVGGKLTEDSLLTEGHLVVNRHFATQEDAMLLFQLYRGVPELDGFNCIAIPPALPPQFASKGGTLDSLLNIDHENYIGRKLAHIITGGFPLDAPGFRIRERVWEANELAGREPTLITELYGASEMLPIASSCSAYQGVHVLQGHVHVEVVDEKTGRHVAPGGRGLVIATGIRHASRFLRYALGDEATYVTEPCRCGKTTPRLVDVQRVLDKERIRQGCAAGGLG